MSTTDGRSRDANATASVTDYDALVEWTMSRTRVPCAHARGVRDMVVSP
jgi:hypothetical protein